VRVDFIDWFGKTRVNLRHVLVDSYPSIRGEMLLISRTQMSKVGWNV
jgi:hypothetical protein